MGEEALGRLAADLLSNPTFADAFTRALQGAIATKGRVDKNIQTLLALLNLPSRSDLHKLVTKLETIQGSLVNLNIKVDRILAAQAPRRARARRTGIDKTAEDAADDAEE
jgi:hypothetical protein